MSVFFGDFLCSIAFQFLKNIVFLIVINDEMLCKMFIGLQHWYFVMIGCWFKPLSDSVHFYTK